MRGRVQLREQATGSGATCREILATVPTWFGIEAANENYIAFAERAPASIAALDGRDIGILILTHHSAYASEVYLLAVSAEHHRHGVGRALLRHAEAQLARSGVEFLQVKTLSPRAEDEGYAKTRAFYLAYGFRPLEEFPDLWDPGNPALQLVKTVGGSLAARG
jgi:ribosomal protein S18 acetylase RimI-like enzyme